MGILRFSAAYPIEEKRQVVPVGAFPRAIKLAPPSHQIRISPEKSEFDAKGVPFQYNILSLISHHLSKPWIYFFAAEVKAEKGGGVQRERTARWI